MLLQTTVVWCGGGGGGGRSGGVVDECFLFLGKKKKSIHVSTIKITHPRSFCSICIGPYPTPPAPPPPSLSLSFCDPSTAWQFICTHQHCLPPFSPPLKSLSCRSFICYYYYYLAHCYAMFLYLFIGSCLTLPPQRNPSYRTSHHTQTRIAFLRIQKPLYYVWYACMLLCVRVRVHHLFLLFDAFDKHQHTNDFVLIVRVLLLPRWLATFHSN